VSRAQRQRDELRELCRSGAVGRAVDLAFLHFSDFGRDDEIVDLLAETIDRSGAPTLVCRRFADLRGLTGDRNDQWSVSPGSGPRRMVKPDHERASKAPNSKGNRNGS
jgi:hypothetical protein